MLLNAQDPINGSKEQITSMIDAVSRSDKKRKQAPLPRRLKRKLDKIEQQQKRARYIPYRPQHEVAQAKQTVRMVEKHVSRNARAEKRWTGVKLWLMGLGVNFACFAVVLVGFWYVATQM